MSIVTEKALMEAIRDGLPGAKVRWGFLEFESATQPPSFPVVCVTRLNASLLAGGGLADMCDSDDDTAETLVQIDSWEPGYEDARDLNEQVHTIVEGVAGWSWQSDVDQRDPNMKAWRIQSTWTTNGER